MNRDSDLDPKELEVGDVVQYENEYHAAAVVEITKDLSDEGYLRYEAEVLEPIFGSLQKTESFTFGHTLDEDLQNMVNVHVNWKIKEVGTPTEYVMNSEDLDYNEFDEYVRSLKEKYTE